MSPRPTKSGGKRSLAAEHGEQRRDVLVRRDRAEQHDFAVRIELATQATRVALERPAERGGRSVDRHARVAEQVVAADAGVGRSEAGRGGDDVDGSRRRSAWRTRACRGSRDPTGTRRLRRAARLRASAARGRARSAPRRGAESARACRSSRRGREERPGAASRCARDAAPGLDYSRPVRRRMTTTITMMPSNPLGM